MIIDSDDTYTPKIKQKNPKKKKNENFLKIFNKQIIITYYYYIYYYNETNLVIIHVKNEPGRQSKAITNLAKCKNNNERRRKRREE